MVWEFINQTGWIATVLDSGTQSLTGSMIATLVFILLVIIVIGISFGIPLEFLSVIVLPFCISVGAYYGSFLTPIIMLLIYVSSIIAKNWLVR